MPRTNAKFSYSGTGLAILVALFFALAQNTLYLSTACQLIGINSFQTAAFAASMPVVIFCVLNILFSMIFWPFIQKPIAIVFLLVGALVNYFMYSFNVLIDDDMLNNVLETHFHEAFDLLTIKMVLWVVVLGVIPSLIVLFTPIKKMGSFWASLGFRIINIIVSVLIIVLIGWLFYKDYASLMRNNRSLVKMLIPSNVIVAVVKLINTKIDENRPYIEIGLDADKKPSIQKNLVVLVIGETARAQNFSLGGYERETNPQLAKRNGVIYFHNVSACGTLTGISLPCMFSNMPREDYKAIKAKNQDGLLDIIARANVDVLWRENDGGCKGVCDRIPNENMTLIKESPHCTDGVCQDDVLLHKLEDYLDQLNNDGVIVLHQMGSHGPTYYKRYSDQYRHFTPTCDTNQIQDCDTDSLVNTYDNTIVYTDAMLDKTIDLIEKYDHKFALSMLYVSDHGESLGESGLYLHGTPYVIAPKQQTHVPMLMWMSENYAKNHNIDRNCLDNIAKNQDLSHDHFFHTILGMTNVRTSEYDPQLDILQQCRGEGDA